MTNLHISGRVYYPQRLLTDDQRNQFKMSLTYVSLFPDDEGKYKTIYMFKETEDYLGLPIEWCKVNLPTVYKMALEDDRRIADTTTVPYTRLPDPNHKAVRDPVAQKKFMEDTLAAVKEHDSVLAVAGTGTGKTAVSLWVAAQLGGRILILIHADEIKEQWLNQVAFFLGIDPSDIGTIQQKKCEWDKPVVVAMLPTVANREFDQEIYNAFSTVIVDECHKLSTEYFGGIADDFNAKHRLCMSATPNRKDGSTIALLNYSGAPRVFSTAENMPCKVHVVRYYSKRKLWGNDDKQRMLCLTRDPDRNQLIVDYIKALYIAGRKVLIVSEKIAQLELLMRMCKEQGVPENAMGQFTAQRQVYDRTYDWKVVGKKNQSRAEIDEAKNRDLVFATIQKCREAWDRPDLDAGIEASPQWNGNQLIGRIRRYLPGKRLPKWITLVDMKCEHSKKRYDVRVREYNDSGAQIIV